MVDILDSCVGYLSQVPDHCDYGKKFVLHKNKYICFYVKSNSFLRENKKTVEFVYLGNLFW